MDKDKTIPALVVDPDGKVVHTNGAANALLSGGRGFKCWNLVRARDAENRPICEPGCAVRLLEEGPGHTRTRAATIRGRDVRLVCVALEEEALVLIGPKVGD